MTASLYAWSILTALAVIITARWMSRHVRAEADAERVLGAIQRMGSASGYPLMKETGLPSSRVYPALARLEATGVIVGEFETGPAPRRRYYREVAS